MKIALHFLLSKEPHRFDLSKKRLVKGEGEDGAVVLNVIQLPSSILEQKTRYTLALCFAFLFKMRQLPLPVHDVRNSTFSLSKSEEENANVEKETGSWCSYSMFLLKRIQTYPTHCSSNKKQNKAKKRLRCIDIRERERDIFSFISFTLKAAENNTI